MKLVKSRSKLKHKGFSLVELIIVIAIMAILASVTTPALLRYINKSRAEVDKQQAKAMCDTFVTALNDGEIEMQYEACVLLIVTKDGKNGGLYTLYNGKASANVNEVYDTFKLNGSKYGDDPEFKALMTNNGKSGAYRLFFKWLEGYGFDSDSLKCRQRAAALMIFINGAGHSSYSVIPEGHWWSTQSILDFVKQHAGVGADDPNYGWSGSEQYKFKWPKK